MLSKWIQLHDYKLSYQNYYSYQNEFFSTVHTFKAKEQSPVRESGQFAFSSTNPESGEDITSIKWSWEEDEAS